MNKKGTRLLAVLAAGIIAVGTTAGIDSFPRAVAATATESYCAPRQGNETGLGTVWLYEAEKVQSSSSLTSGNFIPMIKNNVGNYEGTAGNKATIRINESENKAAYPMAATIEENAVLTFVSPRVGTVCLDEVSAKLDGWNPDEFDGVGLSIYKDGEKIWPTDADRRLVTDSPVTVDAIADIEVAQGTKLRFIADIGKVGGTQWGDTVIWPVSLTLSYERGVRPTETQSYTAPQPGSTTQQDALWSYEGEAIIPNSGQYSSGQFTPMVKQEDGTYIGSAANYPAKAGEPWEGAYLLKPHVEENAVRTFTVPKEGTISIGASTASLPNWDAAWDGVGIAIYKDTTKLWPIDTVHQVVQNTAVSVPAVQNIAVTEGSKIRFVADVGSATEWGDNLIWPVSLTLTSDVDLGPVETRTYTAPKYGAQYGLDTRWLYEAETFIAGEEPHSGAFSRMARQNTVTEGGAYYQGTGVNWGAKVVFEKEAYKLQPNAEQNAVLTFVSPGYGTVTLPQTQVIRHAGEADENDGAGIAVYLNEQKIWPEDAAHQLIDNRLGNRYTVPALSDIEVAEGDRLRFIVDLGPAGGNEWCDDVDWPASVVYTGSNAVEDAKTDDPEIAAPPEPEPGEEDNSGFGQAQYQAPGQGELKWEDVWLYEYETKTDAGAFTGVFLPMTVDLNGDRLAYGTEKATDFQAGLHAQALFFTEKKDGYLTYPVQPGDTQNASITFIAPKNGVVKIPAATVKRFGGVASCDGDGAGLRILVDGRQVWPAQGETALVSNDNHNQLTVPEITDIVVEMDSIIRFVVDRGEANNWCDAVMWPAAVTYTKSDGEEEEIPDPDNHPDKAATVFHAPTLEKPSLGLVWRYEFETLTAGGDLYSGMFGDMVKKITDYGLYQGARQFDEKAQALVLKQAGAALPMRPGTEQNAILTFVAPRAGVIDIQAGEAVRHGGGIVQGDGAGLSIIQDRNQQLWPEGGTTLLLNNENGNRTSVPAINGIQVEEGTLISFVVDIGTVGGTNLNDDVVWPVEIRYQTEKEPDPEPGPQPTPDPEPESPQTGVPAAVLPVMTASAAALLLPLCRRKNRKQTQ